MLQLIFTKLLEISIQASFFILAVLLLRLCFKRLPKRYICILWALVAVRLILPFEINSTFSLVPDTSRVLNLAEISLSENVPISNTQTITNTLAQSNQFLPEDMLQNNAVQNDTAQSTTASSNPLTQDSPTQGSLAQNTTSSGAISGMDDMTAADSSTDTNDAFHANTTDTGSNNTSGSSTGTITNAPSLLLLLAYIWFLGMLALLTYDLVSYLRLKFSLRAAVHHRDNIWYSDRIPAPFVLGYIKPRIYVPFSIREEQMPYIIAHEQAHISHFDHLSKLLAALLVCVYWFNPFVWIAYLLYCKDLELACDERVIAKLGSEEKKPYSEALLICSVTNKALLQSPLSFSEVAIKDRIVNVLNYKKPGFWGVVLAVVVCAVTGVCFLTSPASQEKELDEKTVEFIQQTTTELLDQVTVRYHIEDGFHDLPDTLTPDAYYLLSAYRTNEIQLYGLINGEAMILRDGDTLYPLYDIQWPIYSSEILGNTTDIKIYNLDYDADGTEEYGVYQYKYDENGTQYQGITILEIENGSLRTVPFTLSDMQEQLERISFEYDDEDEKVYISIDSREQAVLDVAWVNKMYEQDYTRLVSRTSPYIQTSELNPEMSQLYASFSFAPPEGEDKSYVAASFVTPVTYSADGTFLLGEITLEYLLDDPDLVTQYSSQLDGYPGISVEHTGVNEFTVTVYSQDYGCLVVTDPDTGEIGYVWPNGTDSTWPIRDYDASLKYYPLEIVDDTVREVPAQVLTEETLKTYAFGAEVLEMTYKLHPYGIKQYILRENGTLNVNIGYEAPDHLVFQYLTFEINEDGETATLEDYGSGYYLLQLKNADALKAFRETYTGEGHVLPSDTTQLPWYWLLTLNGEEQEVAHYDESNPPTVQHNRQFACFAGYNLNDTYNGFIVSEKVVNGEVYTEFRYQDGTDDIIILTDLTYSHVVSLTFNGEEKPLPDRILEIATGSIGGSYATLYYLDITGDGRKELIFTGGYRQTAYCYVFNPETMEEYPIDTDVSDITSKVKVTVTDFEPGCGKLSFKLAYEDLSVDAEEQMIFSFDESNDTTRMTLAEANEYFSYIPNTNTGYIAYLPETGYIEANVWIQINHTVYPEYIGHLNVQYVWDETAGKFVIDLDTVKLESLSGVAATKNTSTDNTTPSAESTEIAVNQEELPVSYPDFYPGTTQYLKDIDWENVSTRITPEENEALSKYLPLLTNDEKFIWIYQIYGNEDSIYAKKQATVRELLADQYGVLGSELIEPVVNSFCFADLFQTGSLDFILFVENYNHEWLIFHEEDGVMYCMDIGVRGFHYPYTNGIYTGSNGAGDTDYCRLKFEDGYYTRELIANIIYHQYETHEVVYINDEPKTSADVEAWKKENLTEQVPRYTPLATAASDN